MINSFEKVPIAFIQLKKNYSNGSLLMSFALPSVPLE
jgi:hypothetical protein